MKESLSEGIRIMYRKENKLSKCKWYCTLPPSCVGLRRVLKRKTYCSDTYPCSETALTSGAAQRLSVQAGLPVDQITDRSEHFRFRQRHVLADPILIQSSAA